jgi:hypothetical protein
MEASDRPNYLVAGRHLTLKSPFTVDSIQRLAEHLLHVDGKCHVTVSGVQWLSVDIDRAAGQCFKLARKKTTDDLLIQAFAKRNVTLFFVVLLIGPLRLGSVTWLFSPRLRVMFAMSRHGWIMPETSR